MSAYLDAQSTRQQVERLKLVHPELAEDAELLADSIEGETDMHEVLTRLVRQEREAVAIAKAIKEQEGDLASRRARFESRQQLVRQFIMSLLETADQRKVMLPEATLSLSQMPPRAVVEDEDALPDEFVRIRRSPDAKAISEALKRGDAIPGARLTNGAPSLTIRVK